MDGITLGWLESLSERYPGHSIEIDRQFMDGTESHPCGFVPNDWNGTSIKVIGDKIFTVRTAKFQWLI